MDIEVDFRSGVPIYIQIMDQVKHKIATGSLQAGDQLPTVRQMAADLRVNFNTIARAYRLLDEAGIISTQHGRGTYILEIESEANGERLRRHDLLRLTRHYLTEAFRLGYDPDHVQAVFEEKLARWQTAGEPPNPEDDS
jgi:GntR family transcriptional regulator